jgi:hypothetical protein
MSLAFPPGGAQGDLRRSSGLGAVAFVPQDDRSVRLRSQSPCETPRPASFECGPSFDIQRLPDNDLAGVVLGGQSRDPGGVHLPRNVPQHCQRAGDGAGGIADRDPKPFLSGVNGKDAHGPSDLDTAAWDISLAPGFGSIGIIIAEE